MIWSHAIGSSHDVLPGLAPDLYRLGSPTPTVPGARCWIDGVGRHLWLRRPDELRASMNASQPSTILIVDAQVFFRAGLRATLAVDSRFSVGEADDSESALQAVISETPDVVLIDVNLPTPGGIELAVQIRRAVSTAAIIVLTDRQTDDELFRAIKVGAAAYLSKAIEPADLVATIGRVVRGEFPINDVVLSSRTIATKVLGEFRALSVYGSRAPAVFAPLSPREVQILEVVTGGSTNKQVAYELGISEQTVKNHMSSILRKLSVNDRTQAVVYAIREGWIEMPPAIENGGSDA
jgi:DNA-binding NarL/FixJ family response regulator